LVYLGEQFTYLNYFFREFLYISEYRIQSLLKKMLAVLDQIHTIFFFFLSLSFPYFVSISICHPPLESCKSLKKNSLYPLFPTTRELLWVHGWLVIWDGKSAKDISHVFLQLDQQHTITFLFVLFLWSHFILFSYELYI